MNTELIVMAKKAADAWRGTDAYHQAATIIDMLVDEIGAENSPAPVAIVWEDITSYSKGDNEREPRVLQCELAGFVVKVHKHIHYGDQWLLTCDGMGFDKQFLHEFDMEQAKAAAITLMTTALREKKAKIETALAMLESAST